MLNNHFKFQSHNVQKYGYVFQNTNGRSHEKTLKILLFFKNEICTDTPSQGSSGKDNSNKHQWNLVGWKYQTGNACSSMENKHYSYRSMWMTSKMAGKKQKLAFYVEETDEERWYWGANVILWSCLFRMHSTGIQTKRENHWALQQDVRFSYFCWRNLKNYQDGDKPRAKTAAWSYDMEGHARQCVELYCELANKKGEQLYKVPSPCLDDHQIKKKNRRRKVNCRKFALMLSKNACTWHELVDLTFCGQSINWHDRSQNGHKPVTDDWHD